MNWTSTASGMQFVPMMWGASSLGKAIPSGSDFLLGFNENQFNIQVRAGEYYSFFGMTMLACGLVFQLPMVILAVTRLGIVSVDQLTKNRRYAYLVIAIIAAALPGVDPVSMLIEMVPLLVLFELSILLARWFGRPREGAGTAEPSPSVVVATTLYADAQFGAPRFRPSLQLTA